MIIYLNNVALGEKLDLKDLPEGWGSCLMGHIADVIGGGTPKASELSNFDDSGYPWLTPADLSGFEGMYIQRGARSLSEKGLRTSSATMLPSGTVLMSSRAPIGYLAIATNPVCTNQGFKSFVCRAGIAPEYVFYWLKYMRPILESLGSGSTFSEISGSRAREIPLVVCPTAEQKRIAAKVEELPARVNAARDRLDKVPKIMKRFRQAVLAAACSGKLTEDWRQEHLNIESGSMLMQRLFGKKPVLGIPSHEDQIEMYEIPDSWAWTRCQDLCDKDRIITYGVIKLGPPVVNGVPVLRSSDVRWLYIDDDHVKRISPKIASEYSRTCLKGGEVLVTVRGTLGGVAVVPTSMEGYNVSREVAVLPIHPSISSKYISLVIGCNWSQSWLHEVVRGVAYTGINIRDLKRLPIPIPPLEEQMEIDHRIRVLFKLADAIEKRVESAKTRADKLTQSILAKAFRGELVPTEAELARQAGRDYEPASELLARIREKKEAAIPRPRHSQRSR